MTRSPRFWRFLFLLVLGFACGIQVRVQRQQIELNKTKEALLTVADQLVGARAEVEFWHDVASKCGIGSLDGPKPLWHVAQTSTAPATPSLGQSLDRLRRDVAAEEFFCAVGLMVCLFLLALFGLLAHDYRRRLRRTRQAIEELERAAESEVEP